MKKRGVFGGKKATSVLLIETMQLLAVGLILISGISFVEAKIGSVGFYSSFYSRDFGILLTAAHGIPGNFFLIYSLTPKGEEGKPPLGFQFEVSNNIARVNASESSLQKIYWYYSDSSIKLVPYNEHLKDWAIIKIRKEGNSLRISTTGAIKRNVISCPSVSTKEGNWLARTFIFDPGHGENASDKGAVSRADASLVESDLTLRIASNSAFNKIGNLKLARDEGMYETVSERQDFISKNADSSTAIISFHTGNNDEGRAYVKAYYNALSSDSIRQKSRKLGCIILNEIASSERLIEKRIDGIVVIPSDSDYIQKIIPRGNVGVLLEIGNVQVPKENNILAPPDPLATAIYNGIEKYHEN